MFQVIVRSANDGLINSVYTTEDFTAASTFFDESAALGYPVALVGTNFSDAIELANQELLG